MAKIESDIVQKSRIRASALSGRLFRNNRGMFLTLDGKRKVRAGLEANGSSDLIGFVSVTVTPDMVGKQIAVFAAAEVKKPGEYPSPDQKHFIETVKGFGGIAGVIRHEDDINTLFSKWLL